MFTGLVEKVGILSSIERNTGGYRLRAEHQPWDNPLSVGDSVAVNGVCLTATKVETRSFSADLLDETVERTTLLERDGKAVNLERALQATSRFGGHFVTGHVDGVGTVDEVTIRGRDRIINVRCSRNLLEEMVPKGSIACDGVSLTIVRIDKESFDVHLIPHTWEQTAFRNLSQGARINLETDLIGKYVRRTLMSTSSSSGGVTMEGLRNAGILA